MDYKTSLIVKGYRVLVKPDPVEEVSKGGILLNPDERLEKAAQQCGTVVAVGETCWKSSVEQAPWAKPGDRILFSKYAGRIVIDPANDEEFMVMNDDDVLCGLKEKAE